MGLKKILRGSFKPKKLLKKVHVNIPQVSYLKHQEDHVRHQESYLRHLESRLRHQENHSRLMGATQGIRRDT